MSSVCLSCFDQTADNDVNIVQVFNNLFKLLVLTQVRNGEQCYCLFADNNQISNLLCMIFVLVVLGGGASTLVRAAMDSDKEIFLTQNTFSQEPFSPELNLEELLADFREVS